MKLGDLSYVLVTFACPIVPVQKGLVTLKGSHTKVNGANAPTFLAMSYRHLGCIHADEKWPDKK